jgi:hypothetical protein
MVLIEITDRQGNALSADGQVGVSLVDTICYPAARETFDPPWQQGLRHVSRLDRTRGQRLALLGRGAKARPTVRFAVPKQAIRVVVPGSHFRRHTLRRVTIAPEE